jgi:hypothetical protein
MALSKITHPEYKPAVTFVDRGVRRLTPGRVGYMDASIAHASIEQFCTTGWGQIAFSQSRPFGSLRKGEQHGLERHLFCSCAAAFRLWRHRHGRLRSTAAGVASPAVLARLRRTQTGHQGVNAIRSPLPTGQHLPAMRARCSPTFRRSLCVPCRAFAAAASMRCPVTPVGTTASAAGG